jgi:hypothetical protein
VLVLVLGWFTASSAEAHNPDTSYARFGIERERCTAKFAYDVTSLVRIVPMLDADGDRRLTPPELTAAVPTIEAFLRRSIALEIDGRKAEFGPLAPVAWPRDAGEAIAEKDYHAPTSLVAFQFVTPASQPPQDVWVRFDFFETLGSRHTVLGAFAHEGQEEEVLFHAFEPDFLFDTDYEPPAASATATAAASPALADNAAPEERASPSRRSSEDSVWSRLKLFLVFGIEHILIGYDHILFLLSLIVVSRFGQLVKIVTSFTVAHSITLALATLGWVEISSTVVETAIAATIVFTALENFWIRDTSNRWKAAFVFGLVHGFGFAGVLRDLELPTDGFVRSLLAFNLGVEVGQLAVVAALALPAALLARWRYGRTAQLALSGLIALCGLGWFVDRAFGFEWMPF